MSGRAVRGRRRAAAAPIIHHGQNFFVSPIARAPLDLHAERERSGASAGGQAERKGAYVNQSLAHSLTRHLRLHA